MPRRALPLLLTAAVLAAAAPAARAAVPAAPMRLPAGGARAATAGDWLVGARPGTAAERIAARHGADRITAGIGVYAVPVARARAMAADLRAHGLLTYAEPDRRSHAAPADPLAAPALAVAAASGPSWRRRIVAAGLVPPDPAAQTRPLALVDSQADVSLPGFAGGNASTRRRLKVDEHGTATLSVAAAPDTGTGMMGVWPGMKATNIPTTLTCRDIVRQLGRAVAADAAAVNMSYGSSRFCYSEYVALQRAVAAGVVPVAAAGNEFYDGNPAEYPASLPHVLTVGALDGRDRPSYFSNRNAAVDLAAPGEGILTLVPPSFDGDGTRDGLLKLDGTSFSAPMVAAAVTWIRAARPALSNRQVAEAVRLSAKDLGAKGWDSSTGYGRLDVAAALARPAPTDDPLEPNEDLPFVDGSLLGAPAAPILSAAQPTARLVALADRYEDPDDVYRLRVPPGRTVRVSATPDFGDCDLELYGARALTVNRSTGRLAVSRREGSATDRVRWTNRTDRTRTLYANVSIDEAATTLDARYTLRASLG